MMGPGNHKLDNIKISGNHRVMGNHRKSGNHRGLPLRRRKNRRSIRLRGYDYSKSGAYFVTICTQNRACLFGEIIDREMGLNDAGGMIQTVWDEIPEYYTGVDIDAFQIMPNHIHGIIVIVGAGPCACPETETIPCACPDNILQPRDKLQFCDTVQKQNSEHPHNFGQPQGEGQPQKIGQPQGVAPTLSLPDVIHRFKTMTTKRYVDGVKQNGWPRFNGKLWQRNYWEHIIRNESELNRIRQYIIENPVKWEFDRNNPGRDMDAVREPCIGPDKGGRREVRDD